MATMQHHDEFSLPRPLHLPASSFFQNRILFANITWKRGDSSHDHLNGIDNTVGTAQRFELLRAYASPKPSKTYPKPHWGTLPSSKTTPSPPFPQPYHHPEPLRFHRTPGRTTPVRDGTYCRRAELPCGFIAALIFRTADAIFPFRRTCRM